jgi:hypothetical protein
MYRYQGKTASHYHTCPYIYTYTPPHCWTDIGHARRKRRKEEQTQ